MTSLHHELPQLKQTRQELVAKYRARHDVWSKLFDQLYVRGVEYANIGATTCQSSTSCENESSTMVPADLQTSQIKGTLLKDTFGTAPLQRSIWGATYSSYLYEYL